MDFRRYRVPALVLVVLAAFFGASTLNAFPGRKLTGHTLPSAAVAGAQPVSPPAERIALAVRLRMQHGAELDALLEHLYTPGDPLYGRYLSPEDFTSQFGATEGDVSRVTDYFDGIGCAVGTRHLNRLLLDVVCTQEAIERAFGIRISYLQTPQNDLIRTIDADPTIPDGLPIEAIHGLTSVPRHPQLIRQDHPSPLAGGSGPNGGLSPSDIRTAYNLKGVSQDGSGQTLGLFELDGYAAADIAKYAAAFGISPSAPLQNVLIDGFSGSAGQGAPEVTLDIELMMAVAPGAAKIVVYEGPNTDAGVIDTYQRIANDNVARQVSTSWGLSEGFSPAAMLNSENQIFKQMAAQGQSIYAASGDSGALDNGQTLSVDDPASQPFITAAGGTTLTMNTDHTYQKETTWWHANNGQGGGGGISTIWPIPSWQVGAVSGNSGGSTTQRNVPDVALDADPGTGYAIFVSGGWAVYGGTSCAAPLWAAFTALVNQARATGNLAPLGFANPAIYGVGKGANYALDFHDIADGSTNGHYPAVNAYDLATGWGTFNGARLLADLAATGAPAPSPTPSPSPAPGPGGGCNAANRRMSGEESTGAALSMGLPFVAGFLVRRRKKR